MAADELTDETTVNDRYAVTIPAAIRRRLDVEPGDTVRWHLDDSEELTISVRKERFGMFDDFEPASLGVARGADDHDAAMAGHDERQG